MAKFQDSDYSDRFLRVSLLTAWDQGIRFEIDEAVPIIDLTVPVAKALRRKLKKLIRELESR